MVSGQKGRLRCPGSNANYEEIASAESAQVQIVEFVQVEVIRQSFGACEATFVANTGCVQGMDLVFRVRMTHASDDSFLLYLVHIPKGEDIPGLEIELLI